MRPTNAEKGNVARFTKEEKHVLISLFQEYEGIIDIKQRKNSPKRNKNIELRQCWQTILDAYNDDPQIVTRRNLKQLQKFWLNLRLRKRDVANNRSATVTSSSLIETKSVQQSTALTNKLAGHKKKTTMPTVASRQNYKYNLQIITQDTDVASDESQSHVQHISIDTTSTDNLSLNDLLEFKHSSHPEIIELKRTENETNNSTLDKSNDEEDSIIFEPMTPERKFSCAGTATTEPESNKNQNETVQCCCTHRNNCDNNPFDHAAAIDDSVYKFRVKEAELKYQSEQLRYEQQKLQLTKTREELQHTREMHRLQIHEMKLKILAEEKKISEE